MSYHTAFFTKRRVVPGFSLTFGITIFWLSALVLIPLGTVFFKSTFKGVDHFVTTLWNDRVFHATLVTFGASLGAALVAVPLGVVVAWTLVRVKIKGNGFFARLSKLAWRVLDALVDLPFALPTAVAGIALTTLYSQNGWFGQYLFPLGIKTAFTPLGIGIALLFVGFPFVVRAIQPVLEELEPEFEEAAATLGASRLTTFKRVIFPAILPATLAGFTMALARAIGEYGSVVFISANMPYKTEVLPLLIFAKLEQYDYEGAAAIGVLMLLLSFALLFVVNLIQRKIEKQRTHKL